MDYNHTVMEQFPGMKESTMEWMQFLSGQDVTVFNFAEWAIVSFI